MTTQTDNTATSTEGPTAPTANTVRLAMITLDCADPGPVSTFWQQFLDWEQTYGDENYAMLQGPAHALGFGRVDGYEPPPWPNPNGSKQFHLDLAVADIPAAETRALELGAVKPGDQPGETWVVLLDPAGHPFCLTDASNWG